MPIGLRRQQRIFLLVLATLHPFACPPCQSQEAAFKEPRSWNCPRLNLASFIVASVPVATVFVLLLAEMPASGHNKYLFHCQQHLNSAPLVVVVVVVVVVPRRTAGIWAAVAAPKR